MDAISTGASKVAEDVMKLYKGAASAFRPYRHEQNSSLFPGLALLAHIILFTVASAIVAIAMANLVGHDLDHTACPPKDAFEMFGVSLGIVSLAYGVAGFLVRGGYVSMRLLFYTGVELTLCYLVFIITGMAFRGVAVGPDPDSFDGKADPEKRKHLVDIWRMGWVLLLIHGPLALLNWFHMESFEARAPMADGIDLGAGNARSDPGPAHVQDPPPEYTQSNHQHAQGSPQGGSSVPHGDPSSSPADPGLFVIGSGSRPVSPLDADAESFDFDGSRRSIRSVSPPESDDGRMAREYPVSLAEFAQGSRHVGRPVAVTHSYGEDGRQEKHLVRARAPWCRMPGTLPCGRCVRCVDEERWACALYIH